MRFLPLMVTLLGSFSAAQAPSKCLHQCMGLSRICQRGPEVQVGKPTEKDVGVLSPIGKPVSGSSSLAIKFPMPLSRQLPGLVGVTVKFQEFEIGHFQDPQKCFLLEPQLMNKDNRPFGYLKLTSQFLGPLGTTLGSKQFEVPDAHKIESSFYSKTRKAKRDVFRGGVRLKEFGWHRICVEAFTDCHRSIQMERGHAPMLDCVRVEVVPKTVERSHQHDMPLEPEMQIAGLNERVDNARVKLRHL